MNLLDFEGREKGFKPFKLSRDEVAKNKGKLVCYVDFVEPYRGTYFVRYGRLHSLSRNTLYLDDKERSLDIRKIKEIGIEVPANIKDWYQASFPTDELGQRINPAATFQGLKDNIPNVSEYLSVWDSIVRERVFEELAEREGVSYSDIYEKWLDNSDIEE